MGNTKGLKDYFTMGIAVSLQSLKADEAELIVNQFDSIAVRRNQLRFDKVPQWYAVQVSET